MAFENILCTIENGIAILTINRPDKLNALNKQTIQELSMCLGDCETNNAVRVIILTGSGEKAFVAGADIAEFAHFDQLRGEQLAAEGQAKLFNKVAQLSKPVIAAINGFALGGGLELAMACHIRFASDNAKMGLPEVSLGVIPGYGGTQRLPQLIGKGRAMELIFSAQMITAEVAERYGLVNHVVAQADLIASCTQLAEKIIKNSPSAIREVIGAVNAGFTDGIDGYQAEVSAFGRCFGTADFAEGTQAFLEKRKPQFTGN